jgi:hypothetical protein
MPLHIDDAEIDFRFCPPVAHALKTIKSEMAGYSVTPSLALRLMKDNFQLLIPEMHRDVLGHMAKATWEELHWTYAEMAFRSGQPTGLLTDIAVAINLICTLTTNPPRDFPNPETIEVTYFLQTCGHLHLNIKHLRYLDNGAFDVLRACKYCWRQPVPGRFICSTHTAGDKYNSIALDAEEESLTRSPFAGYKESSRQKKLYDQMLNKILTKEVLEFHESHFTSMILLPEQDIWNWLKEKRPLVGQLILTQEKPISDDLIVDSLLSILHNPDGLSVSHQQPYIKTNSLISSNPPLIWPMLLRAEAWLVVREVLRGRWGGKRKRNH